MIHWYDRYHEYRCSPARPTSEGTHLVVCGAIAPVRETRRDHGMGGAKFLVTCPACRQWLVNQALTRPELAT